MLDQRSLVHLLMLTRWPLPIFPSAEPILGAHSCLRRYRSPASNMIHRQDYGVLRIECERKTQLDASRISTSDSRTPASETIQAALPVPATPLSGTHSPSQASAMAVRHCSSA